MAAEMSFRALLKKYDSLADLLLDKDLAALGDSYINFVYSLAISQKNGHPMGVKVGNQTLAEAVAKSGLRSYLPHRVDRHARGDAAEALFAYAWLMGLLDLDDCVRVLSREDDAVVAFTGLIKAVLKKLDVADERSNR